MEGRLVRGEGASTRIRIVTRFHLNSKLSSPLRPRRRLPKGRLTRCFRPNIAKEVSNRSTPSRIYFRRKFKLLNQSTWKAKMIRSRNSSWLSRMPHIRHLWALAPKRGTNHRFFSPKTVTSNPQKKPRSKERLTALYRAHRRYLNLWECLRSPLPNRRWISRDHQANAHLWRLPVHNREEPAPTEAPVRNQYLEWVIILKSLGNYAHQSSQRDYQAICTLLCLGYPVTNPKKLSNKEKVWFLQSPQLRQEISKLHKWAGRISEYTLKISMRPIEWSRSEK